MADVFREAGDGCSGRSISSPAVVPTGGQAAVSVSASFKESVGGKGSSRRRTAKPPSSDGDNESIALCGPDPVKNEINRVENEARGNNRELGEAQVEIKAPRLSDRLAEKGVEERTEELSKVDGKLKLTESHPESKNLETKKLSDENKDTVAAQFAGEVTLQSVHAAEKDDNMLPIEASSLEAELKLARQEIVKLQDDNKALNRLTKSKEAALLEAERNVQVAFAKASMVDDLQNKNQELMKQIEIFQFPAAAAAAAGAAGGGGEMLQHHPRQWFPDERDGFISWLRGEFAAANAIIDSLCHHLRAVGEPGEYDGVIGSIQQRRCNWNPVLHMQQYFSVFEVMYALQQVAWRRQHRSYDHVKAGGKEFKRSGSGYRQGLRNEVVKEVHNHGTDFNGNSNPGLERTERGNEKCDEKGEENCSTTGEMEKVGSEDVAKPHADSSLKKSGNSKGIATRNAETGVKLLSDGCISKVREHDSHAQSQNEKHNPATVPKTFVGSEMLDGKMVNVVDGLKLYEELFVEKEVLKLLSLVNDLRTAGRDGKFQGQTYVVAKRLMKGHGREIIQLGLPILDSSLDDDNAAGTSKDRRVEPIPTSLQDAIEHLFRMQVISVKPDSCIIDIYNKGDHSQPHIYPSSYGKPVSILFLTECDITFGRFISADRFGDYKGSLKLSLAPGSLLVMQGRSADFARHALPSIPKQRILVTFTKIQPKKPVPAEVQRHPVPSVALASHWGPPPSRSPNHIRHPAGPKNYASIPSTGVLAAPPIRPQVTPANGVPPLFVPTAVAPAMTFPSPVPITPVSTAWAPAAPRHPPPRILAPGTGVFLPPGSGNSGSPSLLATTAPEVSFAAETPTLPEKENGYGKSNNSISPKKSGVKPQRQDCNGNVDGIVGGGTVAKEEQDRQSNEVEQVS